MPYKTLKKTDRNKIIFLRQKGLSLNCISKLLSLNEVHLHRVLRKVYNDENQIYVSQSVDMMNLYFVFVQGSERHLEVDDKLKILNQPDFDFYELKILNEIYGFRI